MKYFDNWNSHAAMVADFTKADWDDDANQYVDRPIEDMATDDEILFAQYGYESYEGNACVLFQRNGVLYRVDAGHCSCYGLEGQWTPEETLWKAEAMRPRDYSYGMSQEAHNAFWALVDANMATMA